LAKVALSTGPTTRIEGDTAAVTVIGELCNWRIVMAEHSARSWFTPVLLALLSAVSIQERSFGQGEGGDGEAEAIVFASELVTPPGPDQPLEIELRLKTDPAFHVYSSGENFFRLEIGESSGLGDPAVERPPTKEIRDTFAGDEGAMVEVFAGEEPTFTITAEAAGASGTKWVLSGSIGYQGCSDELCLPPANRTFRFSGTLGGAATRDEGGQETAGVAATGRQAWRAAAERFTETARTTGYQGAGSFGDFLDRGLSGEEDSGLFANLATQSGLVVISVIILGGLALNLTPCVLPMIPINLAIIGAGAQAGSKTRGFLLGATYGGAIAFVYGVVGLVVVLTGSTFGALNASPWFNLVIAVVFVVLALAMMDVFHIDFSNLGSGIDTKKMNKGSFGLAAFMGGVAALLAGACVAPVVIAVLLLSAKQYAQGNTLGLAYPFLLGLGMGLPWAFAGAGLSFLPKPGGWMNKVKYLFGIFVLLMGLYYGYQGVKLFGAGGRAEPPSAAGDWHTDLETALVEAREQNKPLLIDFWATWCKNCTAMSKTTLKNDDIVAKLQDFVLLKYQAENLGDAETKAVTDYYEVRGLPTFIVVKP
jgi:thiol:disulfide interchange protein